MADVNKTSWRARLRRPFLKRDVAQRLNGDPALRRLHERCLALEPGPVLAQPVNAARFVVVDTETTGFQAYAGDQIVALAMLELKGLQPTGREYQTLVNPGRPIPAANSRIHGITDAQVAHAPPIEALIADVVEFIGEAVIVGHHVNFDLRFLNKTLNRHLGCRLRNPCLDTMLLYLGHSGRLGHYSLEDVAQYCRVPLAGRHTAHGDALIAARVFAVLAAQLVSPDSPVKQLVRQQTEPHRP